MSEIYVARQPVFGSKMKLYGYELFYSSGNLNCDASEDQATAAVVADSYFLGFEELTDGTQGFINFSQSLLLAGTALLLPSDKLIIEITDYTDITPLFIASCRRMKQLGYTLALGDFTDKEDCRPLAALADIIKVDYRRTPHDMQAQIISTHKHAVFAATNIETAEEFQHACSLGYGLFQGDFFKKTTLVSGREIGTLGTSMLQITQRLTEPEPDLKAIAAIIEKDMDLSYKLLRLANSAYYRSTMAPITSIHQCLTQIGLLELQRWAHLLLIKGLTNPQNAELVKTSLVRGKIMSLLSDAVGHRQTDSACFFTGLFSSVDTLLGEPMEKVLSRLPLADDVKQALMDTPGRLNTALQAVIAFEQADWNTADLRLGELGLPKGTLAPLYMVAIKWQQALIV